MPTTLVKSIVFPFIFLLTSTTAFAINNSLPANCEYGRSTSYDIDAMDVASAVEDGFSVYQNPYNISEWIAFADSLASLLDSFDYLRYEGPKHVLQGQSFRAKANLFDIYANVNFHNSEKGYVGKDKSNFEANSYHRMSFDTTYGYGLVWVSRGGLCSAEGVWVQEAPEILSGDSWTQNGTIYADVDYIIDTYARAAKDSSVPVSLTLRTRSDLYGTPQVHRITTNQLLGSKMISLSPNTGGGPYDVSVIVNDGTFSDYIDLGMVVVQGQRTPPCPNCNPL